MLPFWNLLLFLQNDAREIRHFDDVNLQLPCNARFISSNSTVFCLFLFCLLSEKYSKSQLSSSSLPSCFLMSLNGAQPEIS